MATTSPDESRQVRAAKNQALFRDVNEQLEELNGAFEPLVPLGEFVCECADDDCIVRIAMTLDEYETLRADPRRFAVAPDAAHVVEEVEDVVDRNDRFWVVEKRAAGGELAEQLDRRRSRR